uniref:Uncharacterized protein n=1 Tax=Arcella intermedia TaxID=1963864 RepID=A0A6B2LPA3_9EUKA
MSFIFRMRQLFWSVMRRLPSLLSRHMPAGLSNLAFWLWPSS